MNSFGDLSLAVPKAPLPQIDATTSFGEVHSDFAGMLRAASPVPTDSPRPQISLRNQHGDIRVTGK